MTHAPLRQESVGCAAAETVALSRSKGWAYNLYYEPEECGVVPTNPADLWEVLDERLSVVRQGHDVQDTHVLFR